MTTVKEFMSVIETFAPLSLQESYDNCGLQTGNQNNEVTGVMITLDVNNEVLDDALKNHCNLIIAHHPLTLSGLKTITGNTLTEQIIIRAIKNNLSIYSAHTNMDSVKNGVSGILANKIGLTNQHVLSPLKQQLVKLVTFVPQAQAGHVRQAIFDAGAGHIGNYDCCSYNLNGTGTFRGDEKTTPFVGRPGELHTEPEVRIETILPAFIQHQVVRAIITNHPYEEPAYDIYPLSNEWDNIGLGIIGELPTAMNPDTFLNHLKNVTQTECIRHTKPLKKEIKKVALCGGSGSSLTNQAIASGAQVFVTGDFKYHQFFDAQEKIMIADIGHYESEQFIKGLFLELLTKKFPNFAIRLSKVNSNPIKYY
jgi:dinuclear metal center YbgI/SA1388 family protein